MRSSTLVREEAETGNELSSAACLEQRTSRLSLTPRQNACIVVQCWVVLLPSRPQLQVNTGTLIKSPKRLSAAPVYSAPNFQNLPRNAVGRQASVQPRTSNHRMDKVGPVSRAGVAGFTCHSLSANDVSCCRGSTGEEGTTQSNSYAAHRASRSHALYSGHIELREAFASETSVKLTFNTHAGLQHIPVSL